MASSCMVAESSDCPGDAFRFWYAQKNAKRARWWQAPPVESYGIYSFIIPESAAARNPSRS